MTRGTRDKLPQYEDDIRNNSQFTSWLFIYLSSPYNIFPFKPFLSSPNNIFPHSAGKCLCGLDTYVTPYFVISLIKKEETTRKHIRG